MRMGHSRIHMPYVIITLLTILFITSGCGSSRAVIEEKDSQIQEHLRQIDQLQNDNAELRRELARQTQENRSLNARLAELEKQIHEYRDRVNTLEARIAQPEPKPEPIEITAGQFDAEYNRAVNLFRERKYQDAKNIFTELLNSGIDHPLIPNCQYWIGETLFGMGEYRRAIEEFQKVFGYASQLKHDDAQIMIANSYFMLGEKDSARQEYQRLVDRYPNSDYVSFARQRLQQM